MIVDNKDGTFSVQRPTVWEISTDEVKALQKKNKQLQAENKLLKEEVADLSRFLVSSEANVQSLFKSLADYQKAEL